MKRAIYECPYTKESCDKLDTSTMTLTQQCTECKHYDNGVRPTGSMPILELFKHLFLKLVK